jgi:hypothetical protein
MNVDEICLAAPEAVRQPLPGTDPGEDEAGAAASGRLVLPLERFDLEAFLDSYWLARKEWDEPPLVLDRRGRPLLTLDDHPDEWADELLGRGRALFLPAHERAVDDPLCVSGCRHDGEGLGLGLLEGYGYLVEVVAGVVSIRTALYDAGAFVVHPQRPCGSLAACLATFLGHFVRGS